MRFVLLLSTSVSAKSVFTVNEAVIFGPRRWLISRLGSKLKSLVIPLSEAGPAKLIRVSSTKLDPSAGAVIDTLGGVLGVTVTVMAAEPGSP